MMRSGVLLLVGLLGGVALGCTRTEAARAEPRAAEQKTGTSGSATAARSAPSAPSVTAATTASPPRAQTRAGSGARVPPEERTWNFSSTPVGKMAVVVLLPEHAPGERFPVLVTMHGRGEALKGPQRGARGWVDDYRLAKAIRRLHQPPLTSKDFFSFVTTERLERINRSLADRPYRGMIVVCPYTPDLLAGEGFMNRAPALASFIVEELLPRIHRETPALATAASTGIDGVSLGGRGAYAVGLLRPTAFGVVGGLQAAFDLSEVPTLVEHARSAKRKNPELTFRLLTSRDDYFREPSAALAEAFSGAGLGMKYDVVEGPHDYDFNRGPGAIEMLLFHDRALRGEPTI